MMMKTTNPRFKAGDIVYWWDMEGDGITIGDGTIIRTFKSIDGDADEEQVVYEIENHDNGDDEFLDDHCLFSCRTEVEMHSALQIMKSMREDFNLPEEILDAIIAGDQRK